MANQVGVFEIRNVGGSEHRKVLRQVLLLHWPKKILQNIFSSTAVSWLEEPASLAHEVVNFVVNEHFNSDLRQESFHRFKPGVKAGHKRSYRRTFSDHKPDQKLKGPTFLWWVLYEGCVSLKKRKMFPRSV